MTLSKQNKQNAPIAIDTKQLPHRTMAEYLQMRVLAKSAGSKRTITTSSNKSN